ncbi:MAG: class I SAM-dependent methyltransferase [Pseudomonadales bacterium]|nr:class I SAM-dependent methyltransferase [Pseudomonadales bacterium]MCP5320722.1 class I SAM-dependent methyltransferase [Pseudomonadales bacterium]MCP5338159.1 class I SAM-dependent methyltransferase [Pseudomonadales bacterium]
MSESLACGPAVPVVVALDTASGERAAALAQELGGICLQANGECWRTLVTEQRVALLVGSTGLALARGGRQRLTPVQVDFGDPALLHRLRRADARSEDLARAVGVGQRRPLQVVDATAGWGRDSAVLAALGCEVTMIERHRVVWLLLDDALARASASADPRVRTLVDRLHLLEGDARERQQCWSAPAPDAVLLDPMFPERDGSAAVRKEMQLFQALVGDDADAAELLAASLALARYRVVVKRPRRAPALPGPPPSFTIEGRSTRFDVYALRSYRAVASPG